MGTHTELGYHDPSNNEVYRDFTIEPNYSMNGVWGATHKDYDGAAAFDLQCYAPYFWSFNRAELFTLIDDWYEEQADRMNAAWRSIWHYFNEVNE